uniref:Putative conserved secreted protein n=1 Tax=Xenopsylla cheopis TaxID=163159 RepID=A0A6M2DUC5_XENCH
MAAKLCLLTVFICFTALVAGDKCSNIACPRPPKHYDELKCKPVTKPGACCPERYDCTHIDQRDAAKCYIGGQEYRSRQPIADDIVGHDCSTGCSCREAGGKSKINCANIECPEFLGPRPDPKCILQYKIDSCCSHKTVCDEQEKAALATCQLDGKTYREGERMYPKSNKCKKCVCGKDFKGELVEPFCKTFSCGIEIHYMDRLRNGCVPTYYGTDGCCPIAWRCPVDKDSVVAVPSNKASSDPSMQCQFGPHSMRLGDTLSPGDEPCTTCTCSTPPMVTCIKDPVCYEKKLAQK